MKQVPLQLHNTPQLMNKPDHKHVVVTRSCRSGSDIVGSPRLGKIIKNICGSVDSKVKHQYIVLHFKAHTPIRTTKGKLATIKAMVDYYRFGSCVLC